MLRLITICILLSMAFTVQATIIHVPGDLATIQTGINGAQELGTVLVANGTYTGEGNRDLDFGNKNLVLLSENGPALTTIDCGGELT